MYNYLFVKASMFSFTAVSWQTKKRLCALCDSVVRLNFITISINDMSPYLWNHVLSIRAFRFSGFPANNLIEPSLNSNLVFISQSKFFTPKNHLEIIGDFCVILWGWPYVHSGFYFNIAGNAISIIIAICKRRNDEPIFKIKRSEDLAHRR